MTRIPIRPGKCSAVASSRYGDRSRKGDARNAREDLTEIVRIICNICTCTLSACVTPETAHDASITEDLYTSSHLLTIEQLPSGLLSKSIT